MTGCHLAVYAGSAGGFATYQIQFGRPL